MEHLLEVKNLKTVFHMHNYDVKAVDGLNFHLDRGETLGIVGESGCGKSITSLSVMRLIPSPPGEIAQGTINFEGQNLLKLSSEKMRRIRGDKISMIFQEPMTSLNPVFSIGYQISEALMLHRNMSKEEAMRESAQLLDRVGMSDPEDRVYEYPFQLSGGLRQRAMIAMAMACNPSIMIADEPTTALDVTIQAQILRLMRRLKTEHEASIIFITHDLAVIASFADRVMVMYAGVAVEKASVTKIFKNPSHPYTRGLLESIPSVAMEESEPETRKKLSTIPGTLPDPRNFPKGCRFAPRCKEVMEKCHTAEPGFTQLDEDHTVRCYLYSDIVAEEE